MLMKDRLRAVLKLLLSSLLVTAVYAQMGPPSPAPELKKLQLFAGDWSADGTMTMGPPGTAPSKWTRNSHAEWLDGNFFLVEHSVMDLGPMGKGTELAVLGYDPEKNVYTYKAFNSMGQSEDSTGTVNGDIWTWLSEEHFGGAPMKGRYTMKVLSPTSYTMKFELSQDGSSWTTAMEGKAAKK
ncbi:MAG: DUF1579 family protein [Acidobacteria bacterium]|nr:DUF1579 family protein [Acidobacteriota bacterium]